MLLLGNKNVIITSKLCKYPIKLQNLLDCTQSHHDYYMHVRRVLANADIFIQWNFDAQVGFWLHLLIDMLPFFSAPGKSVDFVETSWMPRDSECL